MLRSNLIQDNLFTVCTLNVLLKPLPFHLKKTLTPYIIRQCNGTLHEEFYLSYEQLFLQRNRLTCCCRALVSFREPACSPTPAPPLPFPLGYHLTSKGPRFWTPPKLYMLFPTTHVRHVSPRERSQIMKIQGLPAVFN